MTAAMRASAWLVFAGLGLASGAVPAMTVGEALHLAAERDPAVRSARAALTAESESGEQERAKSVAIWRSWRTTTRGRATAAWCRCPRS